MSEWKNQLKGDQMERHSQIVILDLPVEDAKTLTLSRKNNQPFKVVDAYAQASAMSLDLDFYKNDTLIEVGTVTTSSEDTRIDLDDTYIDTDDEFKVTMDAMSDDGTVDIYINILKVTIYDSAGDSNSSNPSA